MIRETETEHVSTAILNMPVPAVNVRGALLVGSMPLVDSAAVFNFAAQHLGHHLRRIPDGETGSRINWTQWQVGVFKAVDALESEIFDAGYLRRPKFRIKAGRSAGDIVFPPLGCERGARILQDVQGVEAIRGDRRLDPVSSLPADAGCAGDNLRFPGTPARNRAAL